MTALSVTTARSSAPILSTHATRSCSGGTFSFADSFSKSGALPCGRSRSRVVGAISRDGSSGAQGALIGLGSLIDLGALSDHDSFFRARHFHQIRLVRFPRRFRWSGARCRSSAPFSHLGSLAYSDPIRSLWLVHFSRYRSLDRLALVPWRARGRWLAPEVRHYPLLRLVPILRCYPACSATPSSASSVAR